MRKFFLTVSVFACWTNLHADEYDNRYGQAINLLYQQNKPQEAFDIFAELDRSEPERSWATTFMCGYALRVYLKKPAEALPYLTRSRLLVKGENEDPYKNTIQAREDLKDYSGALRESDFALKHLAQFGKTPSAWFPENRAWLFMQMGRYDEALKVAPAGSWVYEQLAPREIRVDWRLNFAKLMRDWNLVNEKTVRLTMPLERIYQKVLKREFDFPENISSTERLRDGVRYLEITRQDNTEWPETVNVRLLIRQEPARGNRNMRLAQVTDPSDRLYAFATENGGGTFSLDNPEFIRKVESITASGRTPTERAKLALNYLRANFKYGAKPNLARWNAHDALNFGSGDCGYFSYISIAMLRALKIPVRGVYGLNQWKDPAPALPHAIIEVYDAGSRQWLAVEPQSEMLFGYINANYLPLYAANPISSNSARGADGVVEIDTTYFFWTGSGAETLTYDINTLGGGLNLAGGRSGARAAPIAPKAPAFTPAVTQPQVSTGPLPR